MRLKIIFLKKLTIKLFLLLLKEVIHKLFLLNFNRMKMMFIHWLSLLHISFFLKLVKKLSFRRRKYQLNNLNRLLLEEWGLMSEESEINSILLEVFRSFKDNLMLPLTPKSSCVWFIKKQCLHGHSTWQVWATQQLNLKCTTIAP